MRMLSPNRLCFIYSGSTVVFMIILLEIKHSLLVESMRIKRARMKSYAVHSVSPEPMPA